MNKVVLNRGNTLPAPHVMDGTSGVEFAKRKRSEVFQRPDISDVNVDNIAETTIRELSHRTRENGNVVKKIGDRTSDSDDSVDGDKSNLLQPE